MATTVFPFEELLDELQGEVVDHLDACQRTVFALASKRAYALAHRKPCLPYELVARQAAHDGNEPLLLELLQIAHDSDRWDLASIATNAWVRGHLDLTERLVNGSRSLQLSNTEFVFVLGQSVLGGMEDELVRRAYVVLHAAITRSGTARGQSPSLAYLARTVEANALRAGRIALLCELYAAYPDHFGYSQLVDGAPAEWDVNAQGVHAMRSGNLRTINYMARRCFGFTHDCVEAPSSDAVVTAETATELLRQLDVHWRGGRDCLITFAIRSNDPELLDLLLRPGVLGVVALISAHSDAFKTDAHERVFDVLHRYVQVGRAPGSRVVVALESSLTPARFVRFLKRRGYDLAISAAMEQFILALPSETFDALCECYPERVPTRDAPLAVHRLVNRVRVDEVPVIEAEARTAIASNPDARQRAWNMMGRMGMGCLKATLRSLLHHGILTPDYMCADLHAASARLY